MALARSAPRGPVDWTEIRRRMETVGRELTGPGEVAPGRAQAILEERARRLARPATPASVGERLDTVTFALANEIYGIESRYVLQVFRLLDLVPLPGAEPPVIGVTTWRGDLLTILDLRTVLGLPVAALNDLSRVIVLGTERPEFGVLADAVLELVSLPVTEVRVTPDGLGPKQDYVRGVTADAVLVLDAGKLLGMHT